ncbi:MAG: 50S ribosomal protein L21 [Loktanella sp.]|nr:50S ribosomal protein L21 [Loktanella sp.]MDO7623489.1 50S ribosomal protein L21 [Loktanella sp.]MDO7627210.1 50S ribosomal protein L21 [Loktanella sp.]MDO7630040.1 50S ribosomal protein L21 [Loktanella sp.]MDO7664961.1 50S ribosomal protein L21 [Loktanella sp.]
MFAVLKTGGKQYKVASGDVLRIEKLDALAGDKIQFNEILMVGNTVGAPFVADAGVQAEVIDQIKGEKTINFVKRRRKHSSARKKGHRQQLTLVRIGDILEAGADKSGVKAAVNGAGFKIEPAYKGAPTSKKAAAAVERASKPKAAKAAPKAAKAADGDDLTQLTGIGPAAAQKLNDAGVTTFAQVAAIDTATFEVKVSDKVIAQAAELAK